MTTEHRPYVNVCHHALHATDRPAKQQLSPKKAMQEPTNVFDKEGSLRHDERAPQTVENKQWFTTLTNDDHVLYISCMSEQL